MKTRTSHRARGARVALGLAAAGGLALALAGCASGVEHRADAWGGEGAAAQVASQGGAWELVFATPDLEPRVREAGPEHARRDHALNPRAGRALTAADSWPEADRPSLSRSRRIPTRDTGSSSVFYFGERERRGGQDSGWWY
ncbi:MAG: hypothetical protein KF699_04580 [Phycisphaeraceae bacterium]|nr:hypothetical protein [Phycisphaeraceae bacterium]MBX3405318.1 hypothetical protein [Phycisphaeraceae bacterium]